MRAVIAYGKGDVRVEEHELPHPGPGQVAVRIAFGGICGSDLHYVHRGGVGDYSIREPLTLGHEVSGTVAALGEGVDGPPVGTPVTVHPATPCGECAQCRAGRPNTCPATRYLGSAAHLPHVQGGFADVVVVRAAQLVELPAGLALDRAALAEPLAVALHAVSRAGDLRGRRVLVTGAGPIGVLVAAAARHAGATEVVVSDLVGEALEVARRCGATSTVHAGDLDGTEPLDVDVAIEASGAPPALGTCARHVVRGGVVVQVGLLPPGDVPAPGNLLVTKEVDLRGAFRFTDEIRTAVDLLAGDLPVDAVLTHRVPVDEAVPAFDLAGDRRVASKVLLDFTGGAVG
ncbi:L-idonate 5-dehydrogenase [Kineococcus endophyticus]|uniref:L-idonate 5-dehydrogenase n=1 Tax=Kineococcus endophyticus TaxID=1181883 RepID=A0ABV3P900_9ACTN